MTAVVPKVRSKSFLRLERARRRFAQSSVVRDVAGTTAANLAVVALGSIGGILLARGLGPAQRGDLVAIIQWPALIGALASLGITDAVVYRIGRRRTGSGIVTRSATEAAIIVGAITALMGWWLGKAIGRSAPVEQGLFILLLMSPAYIVTGVWISALQALNMKKYNFARSVQPGLYFIGIAALWILGRVTLMSVVVVLVCAQIAMMLVAFLLTNPIVPFASSRSDRNETRALYAFGSRVFVSGLPHLVNVRLDQLFLSVMPAVSASALGQYAVAASFTWLVLPFAVAFGTVAFARIPTMQDGPQRKRLERLSIKGAALSASLVTLGLAGVAAFIVPKLFGRAYGPSVTAVWLLCPGTVCLAVNKVTGDILRGRGFPLRAATGEGIAALITVVGLAIAVPREGIYGAAAVSSIAYAAATIALLALLHGAPSSEELLCGNK